MLFILFLHQESEVIARGGKAGGSNGEGLALSIEIDSFATYMIDMPASPKKIILLNV